jgi:protein O-mannosyl-transferase
MRKRSANRSRRNRVVSRPRPRVSDGSSKANFPFFSIAGTWRSSGILETVFPYVLLVLLTSAIYAQVLNHPFVNFDDGDYVVRNLNIQSGLLRTMSWAFTATAQGNWHPVTWISHAVDWKLFGLDPFGHHLTSLLLHIANTVILFSLLFKSTGAKWRAFMVAALFAIHPLNVQSVAWVSERKNLLSTLFFLLSIAAYGSYARSQKLSRYLILLVTFTLALASKPMVVTLPFVLLLLDYWPLQRICGWIAPAVKYTVLQVPFSRCLFEKIPLFILSAASCVITVIAQRASGAVKSSQEFGLPVRFGNAAYSYFMYLWKALWPARLAVFYPHPGPSLNIWSVSLCLLFLGATTWFAWQKRSVAPYLIVGWLWFLGTLVPVIGMVQVGDQAMADRYAYIPLVGIFVAAVWGIADVWQPRKIATRWKVATAVIVLGAFSWASCRQLGFWSDSYTLWRHALAVTRDNPVSEDQLGMALIALDRQEEAISRFQRAIALGSHDATSYLNVGAYLSERGKQQEAIGFFDTALRLMSDSESRALVNLDLGFAYTSTGDYEMARARYRESLRIDPERVAEAIRGLAQFAAAHPSAKEYMKLGLLLEQAGNNSDAEVAFERVLQLEPGLSAARAALTTLRANRS